jgi:hypothetical protein
MKTEKDLQSYRIFPLLPQAFGAGSTALGLLAFFGWLSGNPLLASFGANLIPMPPSAALLFVVLGLATLLCSRFPSKRGIQLMGLTLGSLLRQDPVFRQS